MDVVEVDGADHQRAVARVRDVRRRVRRLLGPAVERVGGGGGALDHAGRGRPGRSSSPAARPSGRAWRPTGCCRSGSCAELSIAVGRSKNAGMWRSVAGDLLGAGQRLGRHQRDPQPAVGGEALLRREVVGVDLGRGRPAGRRRRRWRRRAPASRRRRPRTDRRHHGGRGLVVRPRVGVDALLGDRLGQRARVALDHRGRRRATARSAAALANFEENSPKVRCWLLSRIRPKVAMSQNAVAPPLPSTTS